ncbi:MAG: zinc protease [Myxococcota bacterium]
MTNDTSGDPRAFNFDITSRHKFGRGEVIKTELANGLQIVIVADPDAPVFAYHTWFRVGSRHEKPGRTGIAHLFEHMMFKATSNLPEGEFDKAMERRGAQTNAATWVDWTHYYEVMPASPENLEFAARAEADRMVNLVLNSEQLEAERQVVINERKYRVEDDPEGAMYERLYALALDGHPYGWPTIGWMADIEAISVEDCQAFYRAYYAPNNATVLVVGGVDPNHVVATITAAYGDLEMQSLPVEEPPAPPVIDSPRRIELELPVQSERWLAGWIGPTLLDEESAALDAALEILFGGESGRVVQTLVNTLEYASTVGGWSSHFKWPGLIEIAATAMEGHTAEELETVIVDEIAKFAASGPTEAEVTKAANQIEAELYRGSYAPNAVAGKFGHYEATSGDYRDFFTAVEAVQKVTAADIQAVVTSRLSHDRRATVVVRPLDESP